VEFAVIFVIINKAAEIKLGEFVIRTRESRVTRKVLQALCRIGHHHFQELKEKNFQDSCLTERNLQFFNWKKPQSESF
jgi:hypothetical protein